jgi:pimeloyl-[acyl-carrier protein] methyl ester esterase
MPGMADDKTPLQVIAMHGWGRDARTWDPWQRATTSLGWRWQTGERGYGRFSPRIPGWPEHASGTRRLVIGRSLGPHMVPVDVFRRADIVVLLASFATFVPPGREGRRTRAALAGMAACLEDEIRARAMLEAFTARIVEPQSPDLLPTGPLDGALDEDNRSRLRQDLDLLAKCDGLPSGFPRSARVLIVEAEEDRIVEPKARRMLREALPEAEVITLPGVGHALLAGDVIGHVVEWVEALRSCEE